MESLSVLLSKKPDLSFYLGAEPFESQELLTTGSVVDLDGGGDVDPQYHVGVSPLLNSASVMTSGGTVYHTVAIVGPGLPVAVAYGPVSVLPGETWYAQLWYQASQQGMPVSNVSRAVRIAFR